MKEQTSPIRFEFGREAEHFWALQLLTTKSCISQESQRKKSAKEVSILVVSDMSVFLFAVTLERSL